MGSNEMELRRLCKRWEAGAPEPAVRAGSASAVVQRSVGIDEGPIMRSKMMRKLVKVKMRSTSYRIKPQQDTVGPFAQSGKEAVRIDLPKVAIAHQQHDSRR
jgi:hypothetical protein